MKIKIIDLLNKIANGEEVPGKIKYGNMEYHINYDYGDYESDIEEYRTCDVKEHYYLFDEIDMLKSLNDEIEIIEEDKKIEKLDLQQVDLQQSGTTSKFISLKDYKIQEKINEIIDKLNEMGDK